MQTIPPRYSFKICISISKRCTYISYTYIILDVCVLCVCIYVCGSVGVYVSMCTYMLLFKHIVCICIYTYIHMWASWYKAVSRLIESQCPLVQRGWKSAGKCLCGWDIQASWHEAGQGCKIVCC